MTEPRDELVELQRQMDEHYAALADLGRRRRDIVAQLRKTMTAAEVADYLGISRARVYAIIRGK